MKLFASLLFLLFSTFTMIAQDESTALPYREIPAYPDTYTPETVVARMVDGLGFRYYWATEGLRPEDLTFKPNEEARTSFQTLEHIHGLSKVVLYPVKQEPIVRGVQNPEMDFATLRKATLENLKTASDILRSGKVKLEDCKIIFQRSEVKSEFPFWNNLNGPLADALWHTGQIVSLRRSSGNPFNSKVSLFNGTVRE
ncbi:MAG: hypothetical protein GY705_27780 [Bacteroidetes bacterium]|nr:hypothetical protein [Bacteroidota bacterium]